MDQHSIDQVSSLFQQNAASNGAVELKTDNKLRKEMAITIVNAVSKTYLRLYTSSSLTIFQGLPHFDGQ
jgi:hypothetical protein